MSPLHDATSRTNAIKCDRRRPKCQTCEISDRRCMGYDEHVKGIFVNINTENITKAKKAIISEATKSYRQTHDRYQKPEPGHRTVTIPSINTLDLSPGEFRQHFLTLWSHFEVAYAKTPDSWVVRLSNLALCNKALDMALVSLATMRLSLCGEREQYQILSLSTYHEGIQIFRRLLREDTKKVDPILVVISLIFTLFEAAQQRPSTLCQSGWSGHLRGALGLMQSQEPRQFQNGGFNFAFKKIREMAVLFSLSMREASFLAEPDWLNIPWTKMKKNPRDRLFDIAIRLTVVYAMVPEQNSTRIAKNCQSIYNELLLWQQEVLQSENADFQISCRGCYQTQCLCLPHRSTFPSNEYSYMAADFLALLLLTTHKASCAFPQAQIMHTATVPPDFSMDNAPFQKQIEWLRMELREILSLPCFGQAVSDLPGITEGRCCSLLPTWALAQVDRTDYRCQTEWWRELESRLNYGTEL